MSRQHILVTGASRGIGRAIAEAYAAEQGDRVVLTLIARNLDLLLELKPALEQSGAVVSCRAIDVSDHPAIMATIAEIDRESPVDIAIINAGISGDTRNGWESWQQTKNIVDTNALGVMASIQPLVETMQQRGRGKLVLVGSISAYRGMAMTPSYCASKAAVMSYGEALRGWLKPTGVSVITVLPGFVASDMSKHFAGPKLMMISAERAAKKIIAGIANNRSVIAFPSLMTLGIRLLAWLPAGLGDKILQRLGYGRKHGR